MDAPPVQYVKTDDGYDIAYCVCGEGVPLVLMPEPFSHLHLMWSSPVYRSLYEPLAQRFQLVQFDPRGQGLSSRGLDAGHTPRSHILDLEAVVRATGLTRFVLYGSYYFGTVAAEYAALNPRSVTALILWNIETGAPRPHDAILRDLSANSWDLFLETYARTFNAYEESSKALDRLRASIDQRDFHPRDPDWQVPALLRSLTMPTLVIARRSSGLGLEERGKEIAALVANARFVLFDDIAGGRYTSDGSTPPLVSAIETFLAALPDAGERDTGNVRDRLPAPHVLSSREVEVLRLLAAGRSNQQIADDLVISLNTVRRHVSNIFDKTGAANRAQAAVYARDHHIV